MITIMGWPLSPPNQNKKKKKKERVFFFFFQNQKKIRQYQTLRGKRINYNPWKEGDGEEK